MIELKCKKKYFDAILELKKPFELRHQPIKKGTIIKLIEVGYRDFELGIINKYKKYGVNKDNLISIQKELGQDIGWIKGNSPTGRYIIFESGECKEVKKSGNHYLVDIADIEKPWSIISWGIEFHKENAFIYDGEGYGSADYDGYDEFCGDYINEKQTYLIEIAKILEVKGWN